MVCPCSSAMWKTLEAKTSVVCLPMHPALPNPLMPPNQRMYLKRLTLYQSLHHQHRSLHLLLNPLLRLNRNLPNLSSHKTKRSP